MIDEIKDFIEQDILQDDPIEARRLRKLSARYLIHDGILYRRSFSKPLLRCVPPNLVNQFWKKFMK